MPFGAARAASFAVRMRSEVNKGLGENFHFTGSAWGDRNLSPIWSLQELVRPFETGEQTGSIAMKYRIAMWASAGFLIAVGWAVYAFAATAPALTSTDPMMLLVKLTCPIV